MLNLASFSWRERNRIIIQINKKCSYGLTAWWSIVGTSLEHPASRSAAKKWSEEMKYTYVSVPHDIEKGIVEAANYADRISDTTRVVTIVHASPITGMGTEISEISRIVRKKLLQHS